MSDFCELWTNGPSFKQSEHFRLSTDSILLSDFVKSQKVRRGIDLGCGSGIIALLILCKNQNTQMTGLDIIPEACSTAVENMRVNEFDMRCRIINDDIRNCRSLFKTGSFDTVVSNPPYFPAGSGKQADKENRAIARGEEACTLNDICTAASYLLKTGGSFYIVHRPERMSELFCHMTDNGIEPKRLRLVENTLGAIPSLILVEGRRGGAPGLKIEKSLVIHNADGSETDEIKQIYHRNKEI